MAHAVACRRDTPGVQVSDYIVADERNGMDGLDWTDLAGGRQGLS